MALSRRMARWFEKERGISEGTTEGMGIYTGMRRTTGDEFEVVSDSEGRVMCFPYWEGGIVVNTKYREHPKKFYQSPGGKKVFYNCDVLRDPQLIEGRAALVIVEGEIDLLAIQEAGNPFVVSVPDGAPPDFGRPTDIDQFDPAHDTKYGYISYHWDDLKKIKRIVMATDSDAPGRRLAEELVRRLGRDRCLFVTYPEGCKDMNEVLLRHGPAVVAQMIATAKPYPVSGVYSIDDFPPEPDLNPVSTGWGRLDDYIKLFFPALMVVTGLAGHGKSTWTNQLVAQLAFHHGYRVAIASLEMRIKPFVTDTLMSSYREMRRDSSEEDAHNWIQENFTFIAPQPSDEDGGDEEFDIDWLISRAITAVVRNGIRVFVIDPWNEIEHALARGESMTQYTGRAIRKLKRFGRQFECLVIVVAHPHKGAALAATERIAEGELPNLSLYDCSDSAHFANKADFGVVIVRCSADINAVTAVQVKKIRYQPVSGRPGSITLTYDSVRRIFSQ